MERRTLLSALTCAAAGVNLAACAGTGSTPAVPSAANFNEPKTGLKIAQGLRQGALVPAMSEYGLPAANSGAVDLAVGSDGRVWVPQPNADTIAAFDPSV